MVRKVYVMTSVILFIWLALVPLTITIVSLIKYKSDPLWLMLIKTILLFPVISLIFFIFTNMIVSCKGDAGSVFICWGSKELGQSMFGLGWLYGLGAIIIIPLAIMFAIIEIVQSYKHSKKEKHGS